MAMHCSHWLWLRCASHSFSIGKVPTIVYNDMGALVSAEKPVELRSGG